MELKKPRWSDEKIRLLALEEASAPPNTKALNMYLVGKLDSVRSLESIKSIRRKQDYKALVIEYKNQNLQRVMERDVLEGSREADVIVMGPSTLPSGVGVILQTPLDWLEAKFDQIIPEINGGIWIRTAIQRSRINHSPEECLMDWWNNFFPDLAMRGVHLRRYPPRGEVCLSGRKARRYEYRRMQDVWKKNMTKAARKVLDGDVDGLPHPSLRDQFNYWKPIFESNRGDRHVIPTTINIGTILEGLWAPISEGEVINIRLPKASAPGLDGMSVQRWLTTVPALLRAAIFNIFMVSGSVPARFLTSRTVLIPKTLNRLEPSSYRPISVVSVLVRHFHKILAARLARCGLIDVRQRAFVEADGCAENVAILSALLYDARKELKQLQVVSLDVRKAFDTVSHESLFRTLSLCGVPEQMVVYLRTIYSVAKTRIEVNGQLSDEILPSRGVRQGDPLSPILFNLVINEVLKVIPTQVGYDLYGSRVNALAFADDLLIVGSTKEGVQLSLNRVCDVLNGFGLELAPLKCAAFSLVPYIRVHKKIKIITDPQFRVGDIQIPQVGVLQTLKYLDVSFGCDGSRLSISDLQPFLLRIRRAPLKPQQRLKVLKTYLIPRFIHSLVLGRTSHGILRKLDCLIRAEARHWLHLPKDIPKAFYHTAIKQGGLGIMSFESSIPGLTLDRLDRLNNSDYPFARSAGRSVWALKRRGWCTMAKIEADGWAELLYKSVDGYELREAGKVGASTEWLNDPFVRIPPSDWLQYIKVWINALPTRVRTTRGLRRLNQSVLCRAGCGVVETAAHVVQQCFRSHGGRILRHDAVASTIAGELQGGGYTVLREHRFNTGVGVRKPDIVASKGDVAHILDVQIVSGARSLTESHKRKRQYYAENKDLLKETAKLMQVPEKKLKVSTITLSWRGIWAAESDAALTALGVSKRIRTGITTRVLFGTLLNFKRFGETTMVNRGRATLTMSGWGPPP